MRAYELDLNSQSSLAREQPMIDTINGAFSIIPAQSHADFLNRSD
jgi:hypothetical protein